MATELTVKEAIEARRSIRTYTNETISDETIHELVRLAGLAPSPWNLQPWRVYAIKDQDMKTKIQGAAYGQKQVGTNGVLFVIATDMSDVMATAADTVHPGMGDAEAEAKGIVETMSHLPEIDLHWWGKAQGYSFMSFLLLAAQSHGYATSAMLGFDEGKVKELLGLDPHARISALVALGRPHEEGFPHFRHPFDRFAKIV